MVSVPQADYFVEPFPASSRGNAFGILPNSKFYGPQGHRGQDYVQPYGKAIKAIAAGIVVRRVWSDVLGNVIVVRHNPASGSDVYSFSCHMSRFGGYKVGAVVKRGATLGYVGSTGSASSGNHLHLAMGYDMYAGITGTVINPLKFIQAHDTAPATAKGKPAAAKYTTAKSGEGLQAIAIRMKVSLATIKKLNANITGPDFEVDLGQKIRYA